MERVNKMKDKGKTIRFWCVGVIFSILAFLTCNTQILYSVDKFISDPLYQTPTASHSAIKIIAIDEKTIQEYGDMKDWDRSVWARLVKQLNEGESDPAVIAFDIMFVSEKEKEVDEIFAQQCADGKNVITAVNLVYDTQVSTSQTGALVVDKQYIAMVEYPYESLKGVVEYGFANTMQDIDGYIRYARSFVTYKEENIDFFPVAVYKKYCSQLGIPAELPKTSEDGVFAFSYTGKSGSYEIVSMYDVLNGNVDVRAFANSIVLCGAYAPGMQDSYHVPVQKGTQMYGVEIHANILEALMEGKTGVSGNVLLYAIAVAISVLACYVICGKCKIILALICTVLMMVADLALGKILYQHGIVINVIEFLIFALLIYGYHLIMRYMAEIIRRKKVISAFKKYVAPQVVDEISKKGDFKIVLGGENRHIAVLFVDIRGFTPMSEKLQPEQVVEILNEYLSLTTHSIFKNGGTLDKFIGDATMAVFNAPFDLDDYIYKAVCTARDIAAGSAQLEKKLKERFGRSVSFGIGVNCGNAVVGNIGCEWRMDYTAIGDTVNTAARLESNAKPGQILISQDVYDAVKKRVEVTEVGVIPLKGKSNGICVYQLDKIL